MSLIYNNSHIGMLLPFRENMDLRSYLQILVREFPLRVTLAESQICTRGRGVAMILSMDPNDDGHPYVFEGCDAGTQNLLVTPARNRFLGDEVYQQTLVLVDQGGYISMGLSSFLYRHQGQDHFATPSVIYQRSARQDNRIPIEGNILLRHRDGPSYLARLHDFSPSGISFYTDEAFPVGEMLLAEFAVPDCGTCETVVTTVRRECLAIGAQNQFLIGVKMQLTAAQRRKAEHIYLCKKVETMKRVMDSTSFRIR